MLNILEYQGETIRLSRTYADFGEYRDDLDNLPAAEIPRVAQLVKDAVIPARYPTREALADFLFENVMFPGYGLSVEQLSKPVALNLIEVPKTNEFRFVVAVPRGAHRFVVDDFIWPEEKGRIERCDYASGKLRYYDRAGELLREA